MAQVSNEGPIAAWGLTSAEATQIFNPVAESPADQGSSYRVSGVPWRPVRRSI